MRSVGNIEEDISTAVSGVADLEEVRPDGVKPRDNDELNA